MKMDHSVPAEPPVAPTSTFHPVHGGPAESVVTHAHACACRRAEPRRCLCSLRFHRVACTVRGHPLPVPPVCPSESPGYILHTRLLRRQGDSHPTTGLVSRRQAGTRDMGVAAAPLPRSRARLAGSPQPAGDPRVSSLICIFSIPWL